MTISPLPLETVHNVFFPVCYLSQTQTVKVKPFLFIEDKSASFSSDCIEERKGIDINVAVCERNTVSEYTTDCPCMRRASRKEKFTIQHTWHVSQVLTNIVRKTNRKID